MNSLVRWYTTAAISLATILTTAGGASATTTTGSMQVSAVIEDVCTLAVNPMAFGSYNGANLDATTTVVVNCTAGGVATLSAEASGSTRQMHNGGTALPYNLYTSSAHSTVWGDGTSATAAIPVAGTGRPADVTIFGNVPASSVSTPGTYNDSVIVTLSY